MARRYGACSTSVCASRHAWARNGRRALYEQHLEAVRTQLDPDSFTLAWAEGQAMALEQAIAYALEDTDHPRGEDPTPITSR